MSMLFLAILSLMALPAIAAEEKPRDPDKGIAVEEYLQSLSTVQGLASLRDPFLELPPPLKDKAANPQVPDINLQAGPLERYPVSNYEVVAVIVGDKYPRALVRVPAESGKPPKVLIVRERDKLGSHKGVITKINADSLIVTEQIFARRRNSSELKKYVLKIGSKAEEQRQATN